MDVSRSAGHHMGCKDGRRIMYEEQGGRVSVIWKCVTFINTNVSQHDYLWSKTPLRSSHFLSASRHIQINANATRNEWKSLHELSIGKIMKSLIVSLCLI